MHKEGRSFGMKFIFIALILFFLADQIKCEESNEDISNSRQKRDYSNSNQYGSSSYTGGNYPSNDYNSDEYKAPICKTPPKCLPLASIPFPSDPSKTNSSWLNTARTFYETVSSCWYYSFVAKTLLGREVRTGKELTEMCLTNFFSQDGLVYNNGFGEQFVQNCTHPATISPGSECPTIPNSGSDGTDLREYKLEQDYLLLTDSSTFVFYYRCLNSRHADYVLYTTTPFVEKSTATQILDLIILMGFDVNEVKFLSCTPPSYPAPFQNYPNERCAPSTSYPSSSSCSRNSYESGQSGNYNNNGGSSYSSKSQYYKNGNSY